LSSAGQPGRLGAGPGVQAVSHTAPARPATSPKQHSSSPSSGTKWSP